MSTSEELMKTAPAVQVLKDNVEARCGLCHTGHVDSPPHECGGLYSINNPYVHYFCMLFTAYSKQEGAEEEGLFGFYGDEVKNQIDLAVKRKCLYCSKGGATAR